MEFAIVTLYFEVYMLITILHDSNRLFAYILTVYYRLCSMLLSVYASVYYRSRSTLPSLYILICCLRSTFSSVYASISIHPYLLFTFYILIRYFYVLYFYVFVLLLVYTHIYYCLRPILLAVDSYLLLFTSHTPSSRPLSKCPFV